MAREVGCFVRIVVQDEILHEFNFFSYFGDTLD